MLYLSYMLAELRRRSGRTLLTALGLAIGVGLAVTVSALSTGLDRAQSAVLEPLTGVGTDMSVSRPIDFSLSDALKDALHHGFGAGFGRFGGEPSPFGSGA